MTRRAVFSRRDFAVLRDIAKEGRPAYEALSKEFGVGPGSAAALVAKALAIDGADLVENKFALEREADNRAQAVADAAVSTAVARMRRQELRDRTTESRCRCGVRGTPEKPLGQLAENGAFWCRPCLMGAAR